MPAWNELNQRIIACDQCPRLREHCTSQQNTFTGRLTEGMLDDIFRSARTLS